MTTTRPRVLLADDHPGMLKALARLLSFDCDVVATVADGAELVEAAARYQPAVVVVDMNLPRISGVDACRRIIKNDPWTKVIVISGISDELIRQEAAAAGAAAFVSKLAASNELVLAIKHAWTESGR